MYDYVRADGELLYQVVKYEHDSKKKEFRQRRPIEGKWAWSLNGTQRVLYRLPHLLEASDDSFVFVVEGEKDADRLIAEGVFATTTSGGAGNSNKTDLGPLSDRPVILVPDNDDAGRKHMKDLASQLHGVAESVRILNLPELPSKGDVSDWLDQGHDTEDLLTLADLVIVEAPAPVPEQPGLYILDDVAPMRLAEDFTKRKLLHEDGDLLWRLHRGDWWRYGDTTGHIVLPKELMRGGIRAYLDRVRHDKINKKTGERELKPMLVNKRLVEEVVSALAEAALYIDETIDTPTWLNEREDEPTQFVRCRNGLLHVASDELEPATPAFFSPTCLPFDYHAHADKPVEWLKFLHLIWPNDEQSIDTLQKIFGYLLTPETNQQKVFFIVGPPRSGKGTIGRILRRLLGDRNVAGPTLSSLSGNFGLQPLIGKSLALVSDARMGDSGKTTTERLLTISGEDAVNVARKNTTDWFGKLPTRFLLMSNELPRMSDSSGALASRFIMLSQTNSWLNREDHELEGRLLDELPGILSWAIQGYKNLQAAGRFETPDSAKDLADELADIASPIAAFIRDECVIGEGREIAVDALYALWEQYCEDEGRTQYVGDKAGLGQRIHSAAPGIKKIRRRDDMGRRCQTYVGISGK
jgi:putative DNA primase/helicase